MSAARAGIAVAVLCAMTACASSAPPQPAAAPSRDPESLYDALGPCGDTPASVVDDLPPGFVLPREAVVVRTTDLGQLVQVDGFVALTPLQVRDIYERRDDVELLTIEDEGFETELLLRDDGYRMYLKAQVLCSTGSNFTATVGEEADAATMPRPRGTAPAAPTTP